MTGGLTRIAPTPSGFLHQGNLLNFRLTQMVAGELGLILALRLDDVDAPRVRANYVDDVFRVLEWMEIFPSVGPRNSGELTQFSQTSRDQYFWSELVAINQAGADVFICSCSRRQRECGRCVRGCDQSISTTPPATGSVRARAGGIEQTLWDARPGYHLVNVVTDRDLGTTHVVRGDDLAPSSVFHSALAAFLPGARAVRYAHHGLALDGRGQKLSKSQGTAYLELTPELMAEVDRQAAHLLPEILSALRP